MDFPRVVSGLCLVLVTTALSGCGGDDGPQTAKVSGKVMVAGQLVESGTIAFFPDTEKGTEGPMSVADIKSDGTYELLLSGVDYGAVVGHHQVRIYCAEEGSVDTDAGEVAARKAPCLIPRKYWDFETSGLTAEVKAQDEPNQIDFDLAK